MSKLPEANKKLGQHFLNDAEVIEKITTDFSEIADVILEVGPGPAILTTELAKYDKPLAVVEMDRRMIEYLKDLVLEKNIFFMDALKLNEEQLLEDLGWSDRKLWLVSNLPYNIASPLIVNFIQWKSVHQMTLMVQKEVGLKIIGKTAKGKDEMSSLHALCSAFFEVSELCKVSPDCFTPPPKVDSMVVSFNKREAPEIPVDEFRKYEKFLRSLFKLRRKQVYNVLKSQYDIEKLDLAFAHCNIPRTARAETFKRADVQLLYSQLIS